MRFFTVEVRILRRLPSPDALRAEPFPAQQAAYPFIGDLGQQPLAAAICGQLRHRPIGKRQPPLARIRQCDIDQIAQLFGAQDRRPAFRVRNLFEARKTALVEAMHPIVCDGKVAADAIGSFGNRSALGDLVDDSVSLVHPHRERQVLELPVQNAPLGPRQRTKL
jgi:hypothetical protein